MPLVHSMLEQHPFQTELICLKHGIDLGAMHGSITTITVFKSDDHTSCLTPWPISLSFALNWIYVFMPGF